MSNMTDIAPRVVNLNAERYARGLAAPKAPRGLNPVNNLSFMK